MQAESDALERYTAFNSIEPERRPTSPRDTRVNVAPAFGQLQRAHTESPLLWLQKRACDRMTAALWAAAGSLDTNLSFASSFERYRTDIPER